jgi:hypothetical protein
LPGATKRNAELLIVEARWRAEAARVPADAVRLHVPLHVLVKEAIEAAKLVRRYSMEVPHADGSGVSPGFASVLGEREVAQEILDLIDAVSTAGLRYGLSEQPERAPLEEGRSVRRELDVALRWLAGSSGDATLRAQVAKIRSVHARSHSMDALAAALHDHAELAARHRAALARVAFDVSLIERARELGEALRRCPSYPEVPKERRAAIDLRNRLAVLLAERLRLVRTTARFVFRSNPALLRQVTSRYERTRKRTGKGKGKKKAG